MLNGESGVIPWVRKKRCRANLLWSFYLFLFDAGILHWLHGSYSLSADRIGNRFEHLICSQILSSVAALDQSIKLYAYRTEHGAKVDFILEANREIIAVETNASRNISTTDLRGFTSFADYFGKPHRAMVLNLGSERRRIDAVEIYPWQEGLRELGF